MAEERVTYTDDGGAIVDVDQRAVDAAIPNISESINIVPFIKANESRDYRGYWNPDDKKTGPEILREMGEVCVEEYLYDEDSRAEWLDSATVTMKLFKAYMEDKNYPWDNCSNVHLPLLTISVLQFHARAFDAIIPPKEVVQVVHTEKSSILTPDKIARGERIQQHMNYQLLYEMEEFEEGMDTMLVELPVTGSSFKKTFFSPARGRNMSSFVSSFDFVVNYGARTLADAQRKTHLVYLYPNEIAAREYMGVFTVESLQHYREGSMSFYVDKTRSELDETDGVKRVMADITRPRVFLEQHREWDLDGDGIAEPVIVTVDYDTREVVRITDRRTKDVFGKTVTLEHFTKYGFIPNPTGFYDIGFGTLMRGLNESAISIVNEVIDAGSLANLIGGFISKRGGPKKGSLTFKMGEWKEIDVLTDDINKSIYTFDFKGPSQTLYAVLGLLFEYSKLVSSVSETMTGQLPASDTPATTVMALIEEGRKVFSSIHKRIHRSFKKELKKLYRLNRIYLDEKTYYYVLTEGRVPEGQPQPIGRMDYADSHDIMPVSDPTIISRAEKVLKAQQVYALVMENPLTQGNDAAIYKASVRLLDALDTPNVAEVFPEPQQQGPPPDIPPVEENAMIITERTPEPLPQQDHNKHLIVHGELETGDYGQELSPVAKRILKDHMKQHLSMAYLAEKQGGQNAQ